jgi:hypothetical protein
MRLTLRTLLAYLDGELLGDRARQIEEKIHTSTFATELAERIRAVRKRQRLSAPALDATGDADANSVAEYLDSLLPPDREAEFELGCLKSDERLAEVANGHHLLGIILRKPAEVDAELRARINHLPQSNEGQAAIKRQGSVEYSTDPKLVTPRRTALASKLVSDSSTESPDAVAQPYQTSLRTERTEAERKALRPEVPDYLRVGRPARMAPWLTTLLLLAVFLFVLANALRPLWERRRLAKSSTETAVASSTSTDQARVSGPPRVTTARGTTTGPTNERQAPADRTIADAPAPVDRPAADSTEPAGDRAADDLSTAIVPEGTSDAADESPLESTPATVEDNAVTATEPPAAESDSAATAADARGTEDAATTPGYPQITAVDGLLLAFDPEQGSWFARPAATTLEKPTELANGPLSKSTLELPRGTRVELIGAARFQLRPIGDVWEFELTHGRALIDGPAEAVQIPMRLGLAQGILDLEANQTRIAIEVRASRVPGSDPQDPANQHTLSELIGIEGTSRWLASDATDPIELKTLDHLISIDGQSSPVSILDKLPGWVVEARQPLDPLQRMAIDELREQVPLDRPAELSLRETLSYRRPEVVALAARSLLELGNSDIYFGSDGVLNNPDQRAAWPAHFESLQAKIGRSSEAAKAIQEAARQADANGPIIYRLLWGFSADELAGGVDKKLVEWLDHPTMAVRVLAFENLRAITGLDLNYRPDYETSARRRDAIKKWEARLRRGDIRWNQEEPAAEPPAPRP